MKRWIGIDPGKSGSLCILYEDNDTLFIDFKENTLKGYINRLRDIVEREIEVTMIGLEKVHAMPGQGVKSMFSFGQRLGELEGMLQTLELGYVMPRPQEWQKACGVPSKSGKKGIYEVISKIYPKADLKGPKGGIIDGRCDSLGIAHYLRGKYA